MNTVEEETKTETVAHYSFCGPPTVSESVPPTIVLNFAGKPKKTSMELRFEAVAECLQALPDDIASALTSASSDGETSDASPEGLAISALLGVAKALSAYKTEENKKRGVEQTIETPDAKKKLLNK